MRIGNDVNHMIWSFHTSDLNPVEQLKQILDPNKGKSSGWTAFILPVVIYAKEHWGNENDLWWINMFLRRLILFFCFHPSATAVGGNQEVKLDPC